MTQGFHSSLHIQITETGTQTNTCPRWSIPALFTVAKRQKPFKCPATDEQTGICTERNSQHYKTWSTDARYKPQKHAKWKKPDTKGPCRTITARGGIQRSWLHRDREGRLVVRRAGRWQRNCLRELPLGEVEASWNWTEMGVAQQGNVRNVTGLPTETTNDLHYVNVTSMKTF